MMQSSEFPLQYYLKLRIYVQEPCERTLHRRGRYSPFSESSLGRSQPVSRRGDTRCVSGTSQGGSIDHKVVEGLNL